MSKTLIASSLYTRMQNALVLSLSLIYLSHLCSLSYLTFKAFSTFMLSHSITTLSMSIFTLLTISLIFVSSLTLLFTQNLWTFSHHIYFYTLGSFSLSNLSTLCIYSHILSPKYLSSLKIGHSRHLFDLFSSFQYS